MGSSWPLLLCYSQRSVNWICRKMTVKQKLRATDWQQKNTLMLTLHNSCQPFDRCSQRAKDNIDFLISRLVSMHLLMDDAFLINEFNLEQPKMNEDFYRMALPVQGC